MGNGALAKDRLDRMHDVLAGMVDRGYLPGAVAAVRRRGEVHVDVIGSLAFGGEPLRRDSIFRITSMTKPVTAVAAMTLVEECRLRLDEPVDQWLPRLRDALHDRDVVYQHLPQGDRLGERGSARGTTHHDLPRKR